MKHQIVCKKFKNAINSPFLKKEIKINNPLISFDFCSKFRLTNILNMAS